MEREIDIPKLLARVPESMRRTMELAWTGKGGKANAVKANCLECAHYNRAEITYCRVFTCPMWFYRPFQKEEVESKETENGC